MTILPFLRLFISSPLHFNSYSVTSRLHRPTNFGVKMMVSETSSSVNIGPSSRDRNFFSGLIDVDCNLLHPDLISFTSKLNGSKSTESSQNENIDPTAILTHPSTVNSNLIGVLSPSSTIETSIKSLSLPSEINDIQIRTTAGVHPYHTDELGPPYDDDAFSIPSTVLNQLENIVQENSNRLASIGECGLDYSEGFPSREIQQPWFQAQIELAYKYNLPLFLHERLAFEDTLQFLDNAAQKFSNIKSNEQEQSEDQFIQPRIIIHCFTGTSSECIEYISRGYYISISGFLLKMPFGEQIRQCLVDGIIPLDRLMIETDAPYMGFTSCRQEYFDFEKHTLEKLNSKQRKRLLNSTYPNVPSSLVRVLEGVTKALNEGQRTRGETELTQAEVAAKCTTNAKTFFGFL